MGGAVPIVGLGLQAVGVGASIGGGGGSQDISGLSPEDSLRVSEERFEFEQELFQRQQDLQIAMLQDAQGFANQTYAQELQLIIAQRREAQNSMFRNFREMQRNLDLDLARINTQGLQTELISNFNLANASMGAFNELVYGKAQAELATFDAETRRNLVDELVSLRNIELEAGQDLQTERLLTGQAGERAQLFAGRASQIEQFLDVMAQNDEERAALRTLFASQGQDVNQLISGNSQMTRAVDRVLSRYQFARDQFGIQQGNLLSGQGFDRAALSGAQGLESLQNAFANYSDIYNAESQYQQQLMGITQGLEQRTFNALSNLQGAYMDTEFNRFNSNFDLQRQAIDSMLAKNVGFADYATGLRDIDLQFARNILASQAANAAGRASNTQESIAAQAQARAATLASMSNIIGSGGQVMSRSGGGGIGSALGSLGGLVRNAASVFSQPSFNIPTSQTTSPFSLFEGVTIPSSSFVGAPAFNNQGAIQASGINNLFRANPVQSFSFQPVTNFSTFPTSGAGNFSIDPSVSFGGF